MFFKSFETWFLMYDVAFLEALKLHKSSSFKQLSFSGNNFFSTSVIGLGFFFFFLLNISFNFFYINIMVMLNLCNVNGSLRKRKSLIHNFIYLMKFYLIILYYSNGDA